MKRVGDTWEASQAKLDAHLASPLRQLECHLCGEYSTKLKPAGADGDLCPRCRAWDPDE